MIWLESEGARGREREEAGLKDGACIGKDEPGTIHVGWVLTQSAGPVTDFGPHSREKWEVRVGKEVPCTDLYFRASTLAFR